MKTTILILLCLSNLLNADFTRNADTGIVTDNTTHLQWQDDNISESMTWQEGIEYCEALHLGDYNDWRLPNINELDSLVDDTTLSPAIDSAFENTIVIDYWSSTSSPKNAILAWHVYFNTGIKYYSNKISNYYIRCVRKGK